ncbi:hypothetical protein EIL87_01660 [Saccharopolyspora rhizosphaerae]|uniref:Uncharacterized protein n=1 Tax=Saccharopolyspora rhizosphaerae TaxID=2492662 RepID=A0A3R8P6I9_9PSEU|nr:hypothetical protein [Saccharopolyspora rhizosphaerae]RRO20607.1 hypothetical protein EIL87_01660 [Saccharopolyspora rhizosphaerae]
MRIIGTILRHLERMPRGYAADGRKLGLATSAAVRSARQHDRRGGARPEPERDDEGRLVDAHG